ncbi:translation initiation factor IF-2-like [Lutra lutra]|uniref:translation initiation factor IF-2-like n=1 Tax=Lutra lutra TaxID=9657 RepID=UPI001FD35AFA|nr:translation initiation factor IF-2-like [Lutra lutra]
MKKNMLTSGELIQAKQSSANTSRTRGKERDNSRNTKGNDHNRERSCTSPHAPAKSKGESAKLSSQMLKNAHNTEVPHHSVLPKLEMLLKTHAYQTAPRPTDPPDVVQREHTRRRLRRYEIGMTQSPRIFLRDLAPAFGNATPGSSLRLNGIEVLLHLPLARFPGQHVTRQLTRPARKPVSSAGLSLLLPTLTETTRFYAPGSGDSGRHRAAGSGHGGPVTPLPPPHGTEPSGAGRAQRGCSGSQTTADTHAGPRNYASRRPRDSGPASVRTRLPNTLLRDALPPHPKEKHDARTEPAGPPGPSAAGASPQARGWSPLPAPLPAPRTLARPAARTAARGQRGPSASAGGGRGGAPLSHLPARPGSAAREAPIRRAPRTGRGRPQLNRQPRRAERRPASGARAPRLRSRPLPRGPSPHCHGTRRGTPRYLREGGRGSWLGDPLRPLLTPSALAYPMRPGPPHAQSSRGDAPSATIETGPEAGQNASLQASDAATEENEPETELERPQRPVFIPDKQGGAAGLQREQNTEA